jgi:hypothetical protein
MLTRLIDHDDSGGGTDGTPHDNAWLQRLNDTIDSRWSIFTAPTTISGTVNDWNFNEADLIICGGAANLTITGLLAPTSPAKNGKVVRIWNYGTGIISLPHANAGSAAANRLFNFMSVAPTPIGQYGFASYVYTGGSWVMTTYEQGLWILMPYAAGNFYAAGGPGGAVWTVGSGNQQIYSYLKGTILTLSVNVAGALTVANAGTLNIKLPNGYQGAAAAASVYQPARVSNGGTTLWGMVLPSQNVLTFWAAPTGAGFVVDAGINMQALVTVPVQ